VLPSGRPPVSRCSRWLSAFKVPQVWLTLLAGAVGFGGMFAVYTYIAPVVTDVAGLGERSVPVYLLSFGLGMVAGTWLAGIMADWSIFRSLIIGGVGMAATMLAFWLTAPYGWAALPVVFLITTLGSVLVVNLQLRLMDVAGDAQTLGAAMNHASLNIANALGAWLGGLVIAAGWGLRAPSSASSCRSPGWRSCCCRPRCTCAAGTYVPDHPRTAVFVLHGVNTGGTPALHTFVTIKSAGVDQPPGILAEGESWKTTRSHARWSAADSWPTATSAPW
jgi:MFS family permease